MSGNNFNKKEKENVEAVTESTAPVLAPTSARGQSNSSRFLLQSEDVSAQMTEVNVGDAGHLLRLLGLNNGDTILHKDKT